MKKGDKKEGLPVSGALADVAIVVKKFNALPSLFAGISSTSSDRQKQNQINQILCDLIKKEAAPTFLMPAVIDFIDQVNVHKILDSYSFFNFELWLNQFSHLSVEENYQIRAKIVGKFVPRDEYQMLFPIAMGKTYPGSHYVTDTGRSKKAIVTIQEELRERLNQLKQNMKLVEAQRLEQRTYYDIEMIEEIGFCQGIENYSRHFTGRKPGEAPPV